MSSILIRDSKYKESIMKADAAKSMRLIELIKLKNFERNLTQEEVLEFHELLHFMHEWARKTTEIRYLWGKEATEEEYQKEINNPFWSYNRD